MWIALLGLSLAAAIAVWVVRDYRAWIALGPGGLPQTMAGWWRMTGWRLQARDPIALAPLTAQRGGPHDVSTLIDLPERNGRRPRVGPHPVPHRQLDNHAPEDVKFALTQAFVGRVSGDAEHLFQTRSYFEKHTDAVTLRPEYCRHPDALATHGEIGHIHPSDGSMHMVLSASDAHVVVARGWGERHGLAGVTLGLPPTYTLIYAPRDEAEVSIDGRILDAAIIYMRGVDCATDSKICFERSSPMLTSKNSIWGG